MAFKRSSVRSRPSPPKKKGGRTDSPSRAVRLGGARGTYNWGICEANARGLPLDPRPSPPKIPHTLVCGIFTFSLLTIHSSLKIFLCGILCNK